MQKYLANIIMLLLSSTAVLSCSMDKAMDMDVANEYALEISGKVMDLNTEEPLEDIKITVQAMRNKKELYTKNAYTDNKGEFIVLLNERQRPSSAIITADDTNGEYEKSTQELMITWDSSHNIKDGIFFINNCNFHLSKSE